MLNDMIVFYIISEIVWMKNIFKLISEICKNMLKKSPESSEIIIKIPFQWTNLNLLFVDSILKATLDTNISLNGTY